RLAAMHNRLAVHARDWMAAKELDQIRLGTIIVVNGKYSAQEKLQQVFYNLGFDWKTTASNDSALNLRGTKRGYVLVAAIDTWVTATKDAWLKTALMETARLADPDPWRDMVRDGNHQTSEQMADLAQKCKIAQQSPQILNFLRQRLKKKDAVA